MSDARQIAERLVSEWLFSIGVEENPASDDRLKSAITAALEAKERENERLLGARCTDRVNWRQIVTPVSIPTNDKALAKLQRLLRVKHEHYDGMNECSICDEPIIDAANAELTRLRAENEELRKALEPLKRIWEASSDRQFPRPRRDRAVAIDMHAWPTVEECRRASELLNRKT